MFSGIILHNIIISHYKISVSCVHYHSHPFPHATHSTASRNTSTPQIMQQIIENISLTPTTAAGVKHSSVSVCASVGSMTQKRMIPKSSNLVQGMTWDILQVVWFLGQKVKVTASYREKIEGDRVAGASLHLYRVPIVQLNKKTLIEFIPCQGVCFSLQC